MAVRKKAISKSLREAIKGRGVFASTDEFLADIMVARLQSRKGCFVPP